MPTAASPAASLPALTTGHVEALVDAEAASALPLLVLVPCLSHQWTPTAWCASEAEAERAVVAVSQRHPNEFNAARAGPGTLPLASLGLLPHADLPALLLLSPHRPAQLLLAERQEPLATEEERPSYEFWRARIEMFWAESAREGDAAAPARWDQHTVVRSAPPPPPPPAWSAWSAADHEPLVSTAASLEADLAATGYCSLLLVHDARMDDLGRDGGGTPTQRWLGLARHLSYRFPASLAARRPMQLDVSRNDMPPSAVGSALAAAIDGAALPAYVRVSPSTSRPERATFASVPARRVRGSTTLLSWGVAHAQSCARAASTPQATGATDAGAAADSASEAAEGVSGGSAASASSWVSNFLSAGAVALESGLQAQLRARAVARVRQRVAQLAERHQAAVESFTATVTAKLMGTGGVQPENAAGGGGGADGGGAYDLTGPPAPPMAPLLAATEWMRENDEALGAALRDAISSVARVAEAADLEAAQARARGLLDEAEGRLAAAHALVEAHS